MWFLLHWDFRIPFGTFVISLSSYVHNRYSTYLKVRSGKIWLCRLFGKGLKMLEQILWYYLTTSHTYISWGGSDATAESIKRNLNWFTKCRISQIKENRCFGLKGQYLVHFSPNHIKNELLPSNSPRDEGITYRHIQKSMVSRPKFSKFISLSPQLMSAVKIDFLIKWIK